MADLLSLWDHNDDKESITVFVYGGMCTVVQTARLLAVCFPSTLPAAHTGIHTVAFSILDTHIHTQPSLLTLDPDPNLVLNTTLTLALKPSLNRQTGL